MERRAVVRLAEKCLHFRFVLFVELPTAHPSIYPCRLLGAAAAVRVDGLHGQSNSAVSLTRTCCWLGSSNSKNTM